MERMKLVFKSTIWNIGRNKHSIRTARRKKDSKKKTKNKDRLRSLWDNSKRTNIQIIRVTEGKKEQQEIENLFEKI